MNLFIFYLWKSKRKTDIPLATGTTGDDLSTKTDDTTSVSMVWIVLLFSVTHTHKVKKKKKNHRNNWNNIEIK